MEIKNRKDKFNTKLSILNTLEDEDITRNQNEVDIDLIDYNDKNFYGSSDSDNDIRELSESIKEVGLLHNIVVKPNEDGRYLLISGEKRTKAYRLLYKETNDSRWKNIPYAGGQSIKI